MKSQTPKFCFCMLFSWSTPRKPGLTQAFSWKGEKILIIYSHDCEVHHIASKESEIKKIKLLIIIIKTVQLILDLRGPSQPSVNSWLNEWLVTTGTEHMGVKGVVFQTRDRPMETRVDVPVLWRHGHASELLSRSTSTLANDKSTQS